MFYYHALRFIPEQHAPRPTSRVPAPLRILISVGIRLALQPLWLQLLVSVPLLAVFFGVMVHFRSYPPSESVGRSAISALIFGGTIAVLLAYRGGSTRKALVEAVAGLDEAKCSQAIAAFTDGIVPADPTVRHAAVRLGSAYLRGKTVDELRRQERRGWISVTIVVVLFTVAAVMQSSAYQTLWFLALGLLTAIALPFSILRNRRLQRNYARLAGSPPTP